MWMLGIEPRSSRRAVRALNPSHLSSPPMEDLEELLEVYSLIIVAAGGGSLSTQVAQ